MIERIVTMLALSEFIGESESIDIAKGKYKLNGTVKATVKQIKREIKTAWHKRK